MNSKNNFKFALKFFISILFVFAFQQPVKAQFFKKLAKHAEEKIKREAERRSERRVDRSIDKGFDKTENEIDGVGKKKKRKKKKRKKNKHHAKRKNNSSQNNNVSQNQENKQSEIDNSNLFKGFGGNNEKVDLPDKLDFSWKYVIKVESKSIKKEYGSDGNMKMIYRINPNQSLFASKILMDSNPVQDMIMLMDHDNNINVMLIDMNGMKMMRNMPVPNDYEDENTDEYKFTMTKIDKKNILGYTCQGYLIESEDGVAKMYFAENIPVSFNGFMDSAKSNKELNSKMLEKIKGGLMMEMEYNSKNNKKHNLKMSCIELKKEPFSINLKDYK